MQEVDNKAKSILDSSCTMWLANFVSREVNSLSVSLEA
jgi:hypothetical protein